MNPEAHTIIESLKKLWEENGPDAVMRPAKQAHLTGKLMVILAEEQEKSAAVMKRQTNKLIFLTWALVGLTFILLCFTIMLYKNSPTTSQRENTTTQGPN